MRDRFRQHRWLGDITLAAMVGALAIGLGATSPVQHTELDTLGYALLVTSALALVARRQAPVLVLLVVAGCAVAYQTMRYPGFVALLPILVAVYTAVRAGHRVLAAAVTAVILVMGTAATILAIDKPLREVLEGRILLAGWLIASGVLGEVVRKQQAYLQQVEQRAADAERTRDEVAKRRAGEERLRIARELHDSLTHCISVIKVQAGVAVHLARKRQETVPDALLAIQSSSNDAMRELRSTLGVLRSADQDAPVRGVAALPDLMAGTAQAGVRATVTITGEQHPLPAPVDRAVFRIVQEALTNVTRHAGDGAEAQVRLDYGIDHLQIQVDDNGAAPPGSTPEPGMGLLGMRERVTALDGTLVAEPRPAGGFRVRATLPVPRPTAARQPDPHGGSPAADSVDRSAPGSAA